MAEVDLLVKDCRLVQGDDMVRTDIAVAGGKIIEVSKSINSQADNVFNADGKVVLPGLIDCHVHFREPGSSSKEDWLTGSQAAAAGGVTTVLDMPNTQPPTTSIKLLQDKIAIASGKSLIDFGFHFGATADNVEEIKQAEGIASVKFYMSSSTGSLLVDDDAVLLEDFRLLASRRIPAVVHAESNDLVRYYEKVLQDSRRDDARAHCESRPPVAAAEAVNRACFLSKHAGNKLHICHVSTRGELSVIKSYREAGHQVSCEVAPHHLFLDDSFMDKENGTYFKVNPPLRAKKECSALWAAVLDGSVDLIATDHAPHLRENKEKSIWDASAGLPGVEERLPLLLNAVNQGKLSLPRLVELTSSNPARVFGIKGKGFLKPGFDADFTVVDLHLEKKVDESKLHSKCGWSPYSGLKIKGWPTHTFVRGQVVYDNGPFNKIEGKLVSFEGR